MLESQKSNLINTVVDTGVFYGVSYGLHKVSSVAGPNMYATVSYFAADFLVRNGWFQKFNIIPSITTSIGAMATRDSFIALVSFVISSAIDLLRGHGQKSVLDNLLRNAVVIPFNVMVDKLIEEQN